MYCNANAVVRGLQCQMAYSAKLWYITGEMRPFPVGIPLATWPGVIGNIKP